MHWTTNRLVGVASMEGLFGPRPALYPDEDQFREALSELGSLLGTVDEHFRYALGAVDALVPSYRDLEDAPFEGRPERFLAIGVRLLAAWDRLGYRPSVVEALAVVPRLALQFTLDSRARPLGERRGDIQVAAVMLQLAVLRRYARLLQTSIDDRGSLEFEAFLFELPVPNWEPAQLKAERRKVMKAMMDASWSLSTSMDDVPRAAQYLAKGGWRPAEHAADRPDANWQDAVPPAARAAEPGSDGSAANEESAPAAPTGIVLSPGIRVSAKAAELGHGAFEALARPMPFAGASRRADDVADLLELRAPWAVELVAHVRRELRLRDRMGLGHPHLRPVLLVGPPGSGKTAVAAALADAMGLPMDRIDAGGLSDNRDLAGTSAGWSSAQPSRPVTAIVRAGVANPLLLVDEVEKSAGRSVNGSVKDTLLSMTEPGTAGSYYDEGLRAKVDISHVTWVMAANGLAAVPAPLLSRVAVVRVDRPGPEFADRAVRLVLEGIAVDMGGTAGMLPDLPRAVLDQVRKHFAGGADLRRVKAALRAAVSIEMDAAVLH